MHITSDHSTQKQHACRIEGLASRQLARLHLAWRLVAVTDLVSDVASPLVCHFRKATMHSNPVDAPGLSHTKA